MPQKNGKLQVNIMDEYRCKNPQQNAKRQNPTTQFKRSSGLYPRDARILQYTQMNQCDIPHEQIER